MTEAGTPTLRVRDEPIGGSSLAQLALSPTPSPWFGPRPADVEGWTRRATELRAAGAGTEWASRLAPAFGASPHPAAAARLARVAGGKGIVVTTGQQPGLFGGPLYTLVKAISALALADAIEEDTGVPTAPVFWAATDDADFAEANVVTVPLPGGAVVLHGPGTGAEGRVMAETPLGDVSAAFETLARAAGSGAGARWLDAAREAYRGDASVGGAYVELLRAVLEPLGIPVLDAWHPAVRRQASSFLRGALEAAPAVATALASRTAEIERAGHAPQVAEVPGLSLVFELGGGAKRRIPLAEAAALARTAADDGLSANVLLRPVLECRLLPTAAYVAGPGEIAYFAQATAVADALGVARPVVVPRWSATVVAGEMEKLLVRHGATPDDLRDPHRFERERARAGLPPEVARELRLLREGIGQRVAVLRASSASLLHAEALDGAERQLLHRVERLERRYVAAALRADERLRHDAGTLRGFFHPAGVRQERALAWLPLLARHGTELLEGLRRGADVHARTVVGETHAEPPVIPA